MQSEMEYIYRTYQLRSFSKAAESLYITQPALSMAIRKVEDSLGMPIFDRSVRPMGLTAAGEAYIDYIKKTYYLEQEMNQRLQDIRSVYTGSIRMGGSHYINAYILPNVLAGFTTEHPNISIEIVESSSDALSKMLKEREVDLTFNCNPKFMADFERYPAFEDHILLAVPKTFEINKKLTGQALCASDIISHRHLLSDCPCVTLDTFQRTEFILLAAGNNLRDRVKQLFHEANFKPIIKMELSQLVTAYHLADASLGATFVSDRLVTTNQDNLFYYKLDSALTARLFYMLLPSKMYTSRAVHSFVDYCMCCLNAPKEQKHEAYD